MKILVINAGSSSLKYQLIDMTAESVVAKGLCERVGSADSFHTYELNKLEQVDEISLKDHHDAIKAVLAVLTDRESGVISDLTEIDAVGHRVVHGGEYFSSSTIIDAEVLSRIEECVKLAPLHNPAALMGIDACMKLMQSQPQIAVFDTAFHQTMPPQASLYPLPYELYESHGVRRYGFHGTSHRYVAARAAALLERPLDEVKLITCHLGNGCSITAVDRGRSIDTSMGFTPLEGLMMGTRCGTIDPAIVTFLIEELSLSTQEVNNLMNKKSGLLGVSGISNDLRDICKAADEGNERAALALELYASSAKRFMGSYMMALAGTDAIVMTAGVGENSSFIRRKIFEGLEELGIVMDWEQNEQRGGERIISDVSSKIKVLVIPTNEELMIAQDVVEIIK